MFTGFKNSLTAMQGLQSHDNDHDLSDHHQDQEMTQGPPSHYLKLFTCLTQSLNFPARLARARFSLNIFPFSPHVIHQVEKIYFSS